MESRGVEMNSIPSIRQNSFVAAVAFILVLLVGYLTDMVLFRHPSWMLVDEVILAVAAGLVVFRYERERSRFLAEKLRVIREMNAFVRNELQILYASQEHPDKTRVNTIEGSVERIDWALRELLPGKETALKETELVKSVSEKIKRSA
jgi:hypothetical protein